MDDGIDNFCIMCRVGWCYRCEDQFGEYYCIVEKQCAMFYFFYQNQCNVVFKFGFFIVCVKYKGGENQLDN